MANATERTVKASLLGANGIKRFIEAHGGQYLSSPPGGRIFRGAAAAHALKKEGFEVEKWAGPKDPKVSWVAHNKFKAHTDTYRALTPVGALVVAG